MIGYRKYENYTKAEQAWLEAIPSHWSFKKNKYIFTEKKDVVGENSGDYVLLSLTLQGIIKRDMLNPSGKFPAEFNTYKKVNPNDIVFCLFDVEETPRTVGHSSHHGMITGAYDVVECSKDALSRYIYYYYLYLDIDKRLGSLYTGLRKVITSSNFFNIKTPLPPLSEQQAIADFLDRKTAQIDTLIEKKQRQIDLLQEQRTALINHAVTKGLNPDVRMKDSGVEWLGEIPSHWKIVKLKYISPNITVGIVITPAKYYVNDGVPCLRSLNVKERKLLAENLVYISHESNELLQKSKIYSGDLVSIRTGQPGTTAVVDERFDGANCIDLIITRQSKEFDSQFLAYQLNSSLSKAQYTTGSSGAIQQHFNVETASNMFVVLPPLDEQIEIRKKLDLTEKRDGNIANNIGLMIQYLQEYRTALISEAVTGKIDVRSSS